MKRSIIRFIIPFLIIPIIYIDAESQEDGNLNKCTDVAKGLYDEIVLGKDVENVVVWKLSDFIWLANYGGRAFNVPIKDNNHLIKIQLSRKKDCPFPGLDTLLPESLLNLSNSTSNYEIPLEMLPLIDTFQCVNRINALSNEYYYYGRAIYGFTMTYGEDVAADSLVISICTKSEYESDGYSIVAHPEINESGDTVIVNMGIASSQGLIHPAFSFAGGSFHIELGLTDYKLIIPTSVDTAVFSVEITQDSIIMTPERLSCVELNTIPHMRLPRDLLYVTFPKWNEKSWPKLKPILMNRMKELGMQYVVLQEGNYSPWRVITDSINYLSRNNRKLEESPVLFFRYSEIDDKSIAALKDLFETGYDMEINMTFQSEEKGFPPIREILGLR